ncbi:DUF4150 domain-containing protein [Cystobacter fuscus]|uniref:DUF4150 domain-containing protein n=1 Tax=Cystobacter fuscus TaxID=43 RepID=UPI002B2CA5B3|nr:DUF4150 domain-containing protein [Cystobacter fuscus]
MGINVYADGNEIACEAGDGKVIAAFPDVCMSPPAPPAGPFPVPYPNSSFSKDMKDGSKTVMIHGKPVMLRDQSYYKSSPLGNEAATRSFGASVVTHTLTGKTYFVSWSMDVQFDGKNVVRHIDLTTSNHNSAMPGATGAVPNVSKPNPAQAQRANAVKGQELCECCNQSMHDGQKGSDGDPAPIVSEDDWYGLNEGPALEKELERLGASEPHPLNKGSARKKWNDDFKKLFERNEKLANRKALMERARELKCASLPEPPCNVYRITPPGSAQLIEDEWDNYRKTYQAKHGIPAGEKVNHRVPKSAGGCPGNKYGEGNLVPDSRLSPACLQVDAELTKVQAEVDSQWSNAMNAWDPSKGPFAGNPFV